MPKPPSSSRLKAKAGKETPAWSGPARRALLLLYAISGFSCLTLETIWIRQISFWAGNTVLASALVIFAFFTCAAAGNFWGGRAVGGKARPLLFYGRYETAAGLAAVLTFLASQWIWSRVGVLPGALAAPFVAALLLVGPPAFLSGVSFPSLTETFVPGTGERTSSGAPFYGVNLLGAALGVAAGGVLLPWFLGLSGAFAVAALLQIVGGLLAWRLALRDGSPLSKSKVADLPKGPTVSPLTGWILVGASGVLSLASQTLVLVWTRQILQGSVYAISGVLAAFIAGLGSGALIAAGLRRRGIPAPTLLILFAAASALLLVAMPYLGELLISRKMDLPGNTPAEMLAPVLLVSILLLLPLTTCLGVIFPVSWELSQAGRSPEGRYFGSAIAWNKLGAAAGTLGALFFLLPWMGLSRGTAILGLSYLILAALIAFWRRRLSFSLLLLPIAGLGTWQMIRTQPVLGVDSSVQALASFTGSYGPVAVIQNRESGSRQILLNSQQRLSGTRRALPSQLHQSWAPLLFCRSPERVLTIGMASGMSAAACLDFPIKELYAVELVPEVVRAAKEHFSEWNAALFSDPRVKVLVGDGRVTSMRLPGKFDAVICDLLFPAEDGTGNLYSREFFAGVREKLNPEGVFCLWLPCYQHDARSAGIIIRTFLEVFPNAVAIRSNLDPVQPVLGLLGCNQPIPASREYLAEQLRRIPKSSAAAGSPFFQSPENAMLLMAGDLRSADPGFSDYPINTDDNMLLTFLGPRTPNKGERLLGIPFLNWMGKRFLKPVFPSCDLGKTPPETLLGSLRAANLYFASANSATTSTLDPRSEEKRQSQVMGYVRQARSLSPQADLPLDALGQ